LSRGTAALEWGGRLVSELGVGVIEKAETMGHVGVGIGAREGEGGDLGGEYNICT